MILPIYIYGQPVLRKVAEPIDKDYPGLDELIQNMKDTMYDSDGIGIAAPQVGVSARIVYIDVDVLKDKFPELKDKRLVLINPEITIDEESPTEVREEGCLSVPGIYADVLRPVSMKVEYYNENLEKVVEEFDKFGCRMVQHELSHLDGNLFVDNVAPIRKKMLTKKLLNIAHGRVSAHYNTKLK